MDNLFHGYIKYSIFNYGVIMKKYFLLFAVIGFSTTAFSLTLEDTFNATFEIDSVRWVKAKAQ